MIKGINRQVIVVKSPDPRLFEEAIFLLREDALERHGVTEGELLEQARRLAEGFSGRCGRRKRRLPPVAWTGIGAAVTGLAWILTLL